ncbi:hypothetical protein BDD30_3506 [Photorhabdus asymbiotica]|uniref:Uncharacterized protein n=1 Tax=Photorhabdus asymbiotica TaxID=291112 RepID=A0ABX9SJ67_9GAMM|nr:hypothetical protein BDD30_3506 [Photorhabdus asymbiotica]
MTVYTLWISRCIATAKERIPGSIADYVTGVSEYSQQRGNLKDDGVYPMDFKMHRDGKGANPREHSELCDWGE